MALPAGYSSEEEWDSGGELSFADGLENISRKRYVADECRTVNPSQKLINAIASRRYDEVQLLLENGADVNYKPDSSGWPSLMHAASLGKIELIKLLLNRGADPNIHVKMTTPLICLCNSNNFDEDQLLQCLNLLLNSGAKIDVYDSHRVTPLMNAAQQGHTRLVSRLLELGLDMEISDTSGWTSIFYAVNSGNIKMVQLLIDAGANINLEDNKGQRLYDLAYARNFIDIANLLAPVDVSDINELTKEMSHYQFYMSEVPDYQLSYFTGFCEDAVNTVAGVGMKKMALLFRKKNIGYGQFLTFTESDWEKVGVNMSFDRKILTTFAKDIIKKKWSREAVIRNTDNINCLFTIDKILSNNVRIVHILVATCYVCNRELLACNEIKDQHLFKEKLNKCLFEVKILRANVNFVKSLINEFGEYSEKFPVDYIGPNSSYNLKLLKFYCKYRTVSYLVVAAIGYYYLFKKPNNFLVDGYFKLLRKY